MLASAPRTQARTLPLIIINCSQGNSSMILGDLPMGHIIMVALWFRLVDKATQ
ncbi:hypothetical protein CY34DRAFT_799200 [Suillus luteus UH-Slu-Lm8-n1]|uniref:Uncharacterized protein n=1 Tax=Suillus luteus UH-Slu-Lm8-n1 TaxID=930992 RepID=A0A0D0BCJ8_9AGAM|nr:hypothetical protein CY34DRAFT_799200 [Suillus luteus UH-Slu-Lm8-n1]